jgi:signal transduction histidine kinase
MIAEVLPRIWQRSREEGERRLAELHLLTRGALAEMRTLLLELRPSALTEALLKDLLRQLGEAFIGRARVPVTFDIDDRCTLPPDRPDAKVALYRIAQEALNNVFKHAGAAHVVIGLHCADAADGIDVIELRIQDDGQGFDPANVPSGHLGLGIMHERAEAIGAALTVHSAIGQGTEIVVQWPAA